jgi:plastocyanin
MSPAKRAVRRLQQSFAPAREWPAQAGRVDRSSPERGRATARVTRLTRLSRIAGRGSSAALAGALLLGSALSFSGADALAGPIKGRISGQEKLVPDVYAEAAKPDAHRFTWREPSPTVRAEFRNLAANPSRELCIAALESAAAPAHEPILIKITGGRTIPATIVVSPGTRLSFENRDPFLHRLYANGQQSWKAEPMNPGSRREWSAPQGAGRFEFKDELFPSVRTYVVVEPQVVEIAYPGRDGAFAMNLAPGDYVLKAYFGGKQVGKPISVGVKGPQLIDLKDPLNVSEGGEGK